MKQIRAVLTALVGACVVATVAISGAAASSTTAPQNTTAPTISGQAREGSTLTATNGTWSNNPTSFSYVWQRCGVDGSGCTNITDATKQSYALAPADVDHRVRVVVTAINSDGSASAPSAASEVVSSTSAPVNTVKPTISGTATVGSVLTASTGTWTGGATTFGYRWQRCPAETATACVVVTGATQKQYTLQSADEGSALRVVVTGRNTSGSSASATSDPTNIVRSSTTTVVSTTTTTTPTVNHAPTIRFVSVRRLGMRVYARFYVCDDSGKNLSVVERDTKKGLSYRRHFSTGTCGTFARSWRLTPYFRRGPISVSLRAFDTSGKASRTISRTVR